MRSKEFKLRIHEEADLFSAYDPDQALLSEDVVSYLERNYMNKHRFTGEQYTLHIYSDTPVNEESVKTKLREYFSHEQDNVAHAIKKMTAKQICLAVFGFAILSLWMLLSSRSAAADVVKLEIL